MAAAGSLEFANQLPGRVQIHQVVVGKLLALQLLGARDSALPAGIERGLLMRILAVAQVERARRANVEKGGQAGFVFGAHAARRALMARSYAAVSAKAFLASRHSVGSERLAFAFVQLFENRGIIVGRNHHRDVLIVLRRRANHGGTADIDVLDQLRQAARLAWPPPFRTA